MANKRMINGDTWEDEFFTSLSIFARLLWMGIITKLADDQGRLRDNAALIRSNIFPLDDMPLNDIEEAIKLFSTDGRIVRYKKDGKKLIQIVNWWKHQKPRWASASNYPAPDDWTDRYRYHGPENVIIENNWKSIGGYIDNNIADSILCEDENEDDIKDENVDTFIKTRNYIEKLLGVGGDGPSAVKAIDEIIKMGAINDDIKDGYEWLRDQGKTVRYFSMLVGPTKTAMTKRIQEGNYKPSNKDPYEGAKRYE